MERNQLLTIAAVVAICGSVVPTVAAAGPTLAETGDDWPTDRGDLGRTGVNAGNAPTGPNATVERDYPGTGTEFGEPTAPAVVDGTMYVGYDDTGGDVSYQSKGHLVAYDASTGDVLWNRSRFPKIRQTPTVTDGRVYVSGRGPYDSGMGQVTGDTRGGVFSLNATTGDVRWARNGSDFDRVTGHLVADGRVYVQQPRVLRALNATTGATVWSRSDVSADAMAWGNGTLVAVSEGSDGPTVTALDPATGDQRWATTTSTDDEYVDPGGVAVANDTVYVSDGENNVSALAVDGGSVEWTTALRSETGDVPAESASAPAVAAGVVYVSTTDDAVGTVHAVDAETGATAWRFERAEAELFAPTVANRTVYVGAKQAAEAGHLSADGVYALNATDGGERWNFARQEFIDRSVVSTTPASGKVYVTVREREIFFNSGSLYTLESTDEAVGPRHQFREGQPVTYEPTLTVTTTPPDAEHRDLDAGTNVTLTANASDPDGTVAAIEWDLGNTGTVDRSGEHITVPLDYCGTLVVRVRVTDDSGETVSEWIRLST
ncbi:PQQ-binding-like beta-propeller repeat protein [Haloarcula pellucida]|uniref:Outer membrane protein assembly factor BamB, contains PQQ-like beta-propeller repeat n=1 Tax=Haloarcula pellucida TaxID=1427151 RepID=A0A830GM87_9EURY|nr:PQQ-binding-like beta-propeller repeat protein [Halomicroarcula pellucida]MBX0348464.1 PQQ-binding-like beta-propeller repeat protein [Halomicroarcula pellucida]GGN93245.1 hypothetical protein GCM10009030_18430 [Halomicroarcula pellucida]